MSETGMRRALSAAIAGALSVPVCASAALAHDGRPLAPHDLRAAWSWEPGIVLPLILSAVLYAAGIHRLWRAGATGRGIRAWEALAFAAGWLALAIALVSPLHPLGSVLFSAHMAQHEMLMAVAAPLLVLGRPLIPFLFAIPMRWRRRAGRLARVGWLRAAWRLLTQPFAAFALHAAALWIWHVPALYQATLTSDVVHTF